MKKSEVEEAHQVEDELIAIGRDEIAYEAYVCLTAIGLARDILGLIVPLVHAHAAWINALKRIRLLQEARDQRYRIGESEIQLVGCDLAVWQFSWPVSLLQIVACWDAIGRLIASECCARHTYTALLWFETFDNEMLTQD